jgi:phosphoenolpyruvate synthase/pyruvate phosphate dikinase
MGVVLSFAACATADPALVGGKALGLGRLAAAGLEVPPGFAITTAAYREWIARNGFAPELSRLAGAAASVAELQQASREIRLLLEGAPLGDAAIDAAYAALGDGDPPVAVRSSAPGEDGAEASFAGQQDTILGLRGASAVRTAVVRCWASLFTPEAMSYRRRLGAAPEAAEMAVVVQRMVAAEAAGVMFTIDPRTGDPSQIAIESAHGLGLPLVGGELTPDRFAVDKVTLAIRSRAVASKPFADRVDAASGRVVRVPLDAPATPSLADDEVIALAALGRRIERALGAPSDIEWALDGERRPLLLQARPVTVRRTPAPAGPTTALGRIAAGMRRGA